MTTYSHGSVYVVTVVDTTRLSKDGDPDETQVGAWLVGPYGHTRATNGSRH